MKQVIRSQGNIVEKIVRDKDGKLIRARFFVYENGGRIKARLLDFVYLAEQNLLNGANFLLSIVVSKGVFDTFRFHNFTINTRTYSLDPILFSGSKPRAPTFA